MRWERRTIENTWNSSAAGIYRNWLEYICAQKERALRSKRVKAMAHCEGLSSTRILSHRQAETISVADLKFLKELHL